MRATLQIESSQISLAREFALPISPPIKAPLMMLANHIREMLREWERVANVICYWLASHPEVATIPFAASHYRTYVYS